MNNVQHINALFFNGIKIECLFNHIYKSTNNMINLITAQFYILFH